MIKWKIKNNFFREIYNFVLTEIWSKFKMENFLQFLILRLRYDLIWKPFYPFAFNMNNDETNHWGMRISLWDTRCLAMIIILKKLIHATCVDKQFLIQNCSWSENNMLITLGNLLIKKHANQLIRNVNFWRVTQAADRFRIQWGKYLNKVDQKEKPLRFKGN